MFINTKDTNQLVFKFKCKIKKRQLNNKIILNIKSKKININNAHLVTGDVWLMWKFLENSSEKNISLITNNSICVEQKLKN